MLREKDDTLAGRYLDATGPYLAMYSRLLGAYPYSKFGLVTTRLVPDQRPSKIIKLVERHLKKLCPPTVRLEIQAGHGADPYLVSPTSARVTGASASMTKSRRR